MVYKTNNRVVENSVAGLPQTFNVTWTHLKPTSICRKMEEKARFVSRYTVC